MKNCKTLKVNEPNVVHETIDGEAILLDLNSGNYFSLDGAGAAIWDYVVARGKWCEAVELMIGNNIEQKETIEVEVQRFIEELLEEKLMVQVADDFAFSSDNGDELKENLKKAALDYKTPIVNKYSDMQDLLLLDPIHDVDDVGWPEASDIPKKEKEE